jgi:hypothetical protein
MNDRRVVEKMKGTGERRGTTVEEDAGEREIGEYRGSGS